ncbi:hypothetical protein KM043_005672 [Ampulex compressa]|nr:hypothetical protein KM043_005672 [Ampulex compressa]
MLLPSSTPRERFALRTVTADPNELIAVHVLTTRTISAAQQSATAARKVDPIATCWHPLEPLEMQEQKSLRPSGDFENRRRIDARREARWIF